MENLRTTGDDEWKKGSSGQTAQFLYKNGFIDEQGYQNLLEGRPSSAPRIDQPQNQNADPLPPYKQTDGYWGQEGGDPMPHVEK